MNLPTGTVTFLFTDIEGSTKLWEQDPESMRMALARHDGLMRAAIEANAGHVFKTVGDAFCAAFATGIDALNAALMAQVALLQPEWAETGSIRVRMAIHTGDAEERDNDYFGPTLNRVARLLGIGYGQQILLSNITYELIRGVLRQDASLVDHGMHRLRDLGAAEHVWQLSHPSLPQEFPPLKSLNYLSTNVPQQLTSFIGREKEVADIKELLQTSRLLTLTGSGGSGKSRLSLQASAETLEQYADGVWLVELAPLSDPSTVPQTVADTLNVREVPGEQITKTLISSLRSKDMLIVLDNCEHVLQASACLVDALLKSCPKLRMMVSSREALGIAGEYAYRVPSLTTPDMKQPQTLEQLLRYESVRLFIDRAAIANRDFSVTALNASTLASVCRRLDGVPLAIELAAARVRAMPLEQIEARLDGAFRLLTGGSRTALPRQQTLKALIDWSYDLLNDQEKALLSRLSVFSGGWTLEAAEAVCAGGAEMAGDPLPIADRLFPADVLDLLTSLVDKSLVLYMQRETTGRYRLLETVRQYSRDRLVHSGETDIVRSRHCDYFLALAEETSPKLSGVNQAHWLQVLEEEHDNLRASLEWILSVPGAAEGGLRFCGALSNFWWIRGHLSEGREWTRRALGRAEAVERTDDLAMAYYSAGAMAFYQGDVDAAEADYEVSLAIWGEIGDKKGVGASLIGIANVESCRGDNLSARARYEDAVALYREIEDKRGLANSLNNLGSLVSDIGDYASSKAFQEESLAIEREIGNRGGMGNTLTNLGNAAYSHGDFASARRYYEESLPIRRELDDRIGLGRSVNGLGNVAYSRGDFPSARAHHEESLAIRREVGDRKGIGSSLNNLGRVAVAVGDYETARNYYKESLIILTEIGDRGGVASSLESFAGLAARESQLERAAVMWGAAEALREEIRSPMAPVDREQYDLDVAGTRKALGEEMFSAAWAAGCGMALEQATAIALGACLRKNFEFAESFRLRLSNLLL